jgi:hypothetical protein
MPIWRIPYGFSMTLPAPRAWTYRWLTDYDADDFELLGLPAHRSVERWAENLFLLTDRFDADPFDPRRGIRSVKEKLVHLYPENWAWTSTHLSGPAKGSQFVYELHPHGSRATRIRYTGAQVEEAPGRPSAESVARRAAQLRAEDVGAWRNLARAIAAEYGSRPHRSGRSGRRRR